MGGGFSRSGRSAHFPHLLSERGGLPTALPSPNGRQFSWPNQVPRKRFMLLVRLPQLLVAADVGEDFPLCFSSLGSVREIDVGVPHRLDVVFIDVEPSTSLVSRGLRRCSALERTR